MKRPGDGWTKIRYFKCPYCGKKGWYVCEYGLRCKYCKKSKVDCYILAGGFK